MNGNQLRRPFADRRSNTCLRLIFGIATLCWATPEATAGSLPPVTIPPLQIVTSETGTGSLAEVTTSGIPSASATVSFDPNGSSASSDLLYYLEVVGPAGDIAPLRITSTTSYTYNVGNGAAFFAEAYFALGSIYSQYNIVAAGYPQIGDGTMTSTRSLGVAFNTDTPILMDVHAQASLYGGFPSYFVTTASDPAISFAPGFDSTGYTLEFSAGIGNSSVPEPSTLLLSGIAAVVGLGVWARRLRSV